jgi:DNA repair exonuclease SbcCD nuclease subunit
MFKFIHTADIHLDSPLCGLEAHEGAPVAEIRGATRRAFSNLVELALEERVAFLLIAGDVFDGDWKDFNTGLFFNREMGRLEQAGIRVFLISGNHDAASSITRTLSLPANVIRFSSAVCESVEIPELQTVVHGRSYPAAAVTENLAADFPPFVSGAFNIGMLHTALTGRSGHAPYAPCSRGDLESKGYDYWALGHVHAGEVIAEAPHIVFPGNIQGRHIRETGAKSVILASVEEGSIVDIQTREVDVLRWELCRLELIECRTAAMLIDLVRSVLMQKSKEAGGLPLAVRIVLEGVCPLHEDLQARRQYWLEEFRAIAAAIGSIWLERVKFRTTRKVGLEELIGEDSPLFSVLQAAGFLELDDELLAGLETELAGLKAKVPPELVEPGTLLAGADGELTEVQKEVREMLIAGLLRQGGGE